MKCPECQVWTTVIESRAKPDGYVRIRECANGHRFKTVEVVVPKSCPRCGEKNLAQIHTCTPKDQP